MLLIQDEHITHRTSEDTQRSLFWLSLACRWLVAGLSLACLWLVSGLSAILLRVPNGHFGQVTTLALQLDCRPAHCFFLLSAVPSHPAEKMSAAYAELPSLPSLLSHPHPIRLLPHTWPFRTHCRPAEQKISKRAARPHGPNLLPAAGIRNSKQTTNNKQQTTNKEKSRKKSTRPPTLNRGLPS